MLNERALNTRIVTVAEGMQDLRFEWDDLLHRARCAGVFQSWEWNSACRQHFGQGKKLHLICVRDQDRLVGLAPLEITSMYGLPFRRLQFIGTGTFDYLDFILDPDYEKSALDAITAEITDNGDLWDLVDLQNLHESSPSVGLTTAFDKNPEFEGELLDGEVCPYLPLAGSWEEMQGSFGKKMRFNLGYYERTARKDFQAVDYGTLSRDELGEGMDAFFRLHTIRWKKRFLPGVLVGGKRQDFHREVASLCLNRGWLHLHGLRIDGELQAVLYCFAFKGKGYYYLGGFDPKLSKYSPGTVLTGFAIRRAIEEGCGEFDFLRGNEPYKSRWTKLHRTNSRFVVRKNTARSKAAAALCRLEQRIEHRVKHELHKRIGAG